jgi:uncharacterized protein YciI
MHFVIFATDRPDHEKVRDGEQPRHHAYIHDPGLPVRMQVAGPTLDPDSETLNGSLFIIEAEDMAAAEAFVEGAMFLNVSSSGVCILIKLHP